MKIALLGAGKTGQFVKVLSKNTTVFNSKNRLTSEKIQDCDVVICFVTSSVLELYLDELIKSNKPVVIASTGKDLRDSLHEKLVKKNISWIYSSNYSKSLALYKSIITFLKSQDKSLTDMHRSIVDIHHNKKLDSPSGTALTIKNWYAQDIEIKSIREGDHIGTHSFVISNNLEEISITHTIKDRSVFAAGAIEAAKLLINNNLPLGLNQFYEVINE